MGRNKYRSPKKRQEDKQRYYKKHREHPDNRKNSNKRWTELEILLITSEKNLPDSILGKQIGRSVQAIHVKRAELRRNAASR
ncbi:MAG: hypothetical protein AAB906_00140 [Patescibacteria group bacterium]